MEELSILILFYFILDFYEFKFECELKIPSKKSRNQPWDKVKISICGMYARAQFFDLGPINLQA